MPADATIADWLRAYRAAYGLTQARAAGLVGVSKSAWENWEQGTRQPPWKVLSMLAQSTALGTVPGPPCPCCGRSSGR